VADIAIVSAVMERKLIIFFFFIESPPKAIVPFSGNQFSA